MVWVNVLSFKAYLISGVELPQNEQSEHSWQACTKPKLEAKKSLKTRVHARRPTNLEGLERFAKEDSSGDMPETCWELQQMTKANGIHHLV